MIRRNYFPFIVFAASLIAFANTLHFPFVHDDHVFIVHNPNIARWDNLGQVFCPAALDAAGVNTYYRPLLEILNRLIYSVFGPNPAAWHLVNIIVHAVNGVLVFWLWRRLQFDDLTAFAAAMIFALHPVQSESVAAIAGISNLLMALAVLGTLHLYLAGRFGWAFICFTVGMLTKEQSVMAVPLLILLDWYRKQKHFWIWVEFAAWAAVFIWVRGLLSGSRLLEDIFASPGELKLRLLAIPQSLDIYVRILLMPYDLHYYRCLDIMTAARWLWVPAIAFILLILRWLRQIRLGAFWFLLALLPVLNIVPLVNEFSFILNAEHFLYLPLAGFTLMVCILTMGIMRKILIPLVIVLGFLTVGQNMFFSSESALFERVVKHEPKFGRGHYHLAKAYYFEQRFKEADVHFAEGFKIMQGYYEKTQGAPQTFYADFMKRILFDWAHNDEQLNRLDAAGQKYVRAGILDPEDASIWNNLGVLSMRMGKTDQAKSYFKKAMQVDPQFISARQNLNHIK